MDLDKIRNKDTFKFFNWKWSRVPQWGEETKHIYHKWYLDKYNFSEESFQKFLSRKKRLLDVGCGVGRDIKFFRENSKDSKIVGIDQSEFAINFLQKENLKNVDLIRLDITKDLGSLGKFDFISCDQVLHHTPNPKQTILDLTNILELGGHMHLFVCKKKNELRDLIDDKIMHHSRYMSPGELWDFSVKVTEFGKALHSLNIENIEYQGKNYKSLQSLIHNQTFRCWYNPEIDFDLSVSSNYDWFSNNPRYSKEEFLSFFNPVKNISIENVYEDDACVAVRIIKNSN
jgi:SAM-dependent methyltransferase